MASMLTYQYAPTADAPAAAQHPRTDILPEAVTADY